MPLVLVHNDVVRNPAHAWDDVEGVRYHYPAKYQGKVITGEPFVYYRGVLRADGSRGPAQYVGSGRIGAVWADPDRPTGAKKAWYCAIDDYQRFGQAVPAKIDDVLLETIPQNFWRDGVRALDPAVYQRIMTLAAAQPPLIVTAPPPTGVVIAASDRLIMPPAPVAGAGGGGKSSFRKSKQAKVVGDWAEGIALRYIKEQVAGCTACVHRAGDGETPGWDIDYRDADGVLQRVEVKGTVSGAFTGVELTAGEMRAAKAHGEGYWLYLVAGCLTERPKVQAVRNPAALLADGLWAAIPSMFSVRFGSSVGKLNEPARLDAAAMVGDRV